MKIFRWLSVAFLLAIAPAFAAWHSVLQVAVSGGGGGCAQATTFLARTSGLDATHQAAYTTMICGLVTDGVWSTGDEFQVFATADATTAGLNLTSTSHTITVNGAPTFTANSGYVGGTSSNFLTAYNPTIGTNSLVQDSATICEWSLTNTNQTTSLVYNQSTSHEIQIYPRFTDNHMYAGVNSSDDPSGIAVSRADGFKCASRTGSTGYSYYDGGANVGTRTTASVTLNNSTILLAGGAPVNNNPNNIAVFWAGGGLNDTQMTALYNRVHPYMQTIAGAP